MAPGKLFFKRLRPIQPENPWYDVFQKSRIMDMKSIWTIGHSVHGISQFIDMLSAFNIESVADIRRFPGSRRYPHFNKEALMRSLAERNIAYEHFEDLGGRRTPSKDSRNSAWRNAAFRGYADYMETEQFLHSFFGLEERAVKQRTAYMCSEAVWWSCHRALLSDLFKSRGWAVLHILSTSKADEHPWTKPARVVDNKLTYAESSLNF
jgi:uncharacterized protein (DUF488 family)